MHVGRTGLRALLGLLSALAWSRFVVGQECGTCQPCQPAPAPAACSVLVPQLITEYRTEVVTRFRPETRQRTVTVYRDVPGTETVQEDYTVLVPQTRVRMVADTINHPVYGSIQLRTTSMTPRIESRRGTYTVSRLVPVREERCESACCSTTTSLPPALAPLPAAPGGLDPNAPPPPPGAASPTDPSVACGGCDTCCTTCAPRKVCVTCWKPVSQQVTVQYPVTHLDPSSRLDTVPFYEYEKETKFREESYVVEVPERRTRTREIAVTRSVAEQRPEQYTVMVPHQECIQVPVLTCRYVEQPVIIR